MEFQSRNIIWLVFFRDCSVLVKAQGGAWPGVVTGGCCHLWAGGVGVQIVKKLVSDNSLGVACQLHASGCGSEQILEHPCSSVGATLSSISGTV